MEMIYKHVIENETYFNELFEDESGRLNNNHT
jgi:hypothetical protein